MAKLPRLGMISCSLLLMTLCAPLVRAAPLAPGRQYLVPEGEISDEQKDLYALNSGMVSALVFSHGGNTLAAATEDGTTCLWDLATSRPSRCVNEPAFARAKTAALAFSAHDEWVAAGLLDGSVATWRSDGRQQEASCRLAPLPSSLTLGRPISALVFTPEGGSLLAVGSKNGTVRNCDRSFETASGLAQPDPAKAASLPELAGLPAGLFALTAFDPSGRFLAVATSSALGIWNPRTGEQRWLHRIVSSLVTAMAISPDGKLLVTGLLSGNVSLWDVTTGREQLLPEGHAKAVTAVAFTADGRRLATGSEDFSIALWDIPTKNRLQTLVSSSAVSSLAFHPDGVVLASASNEQSITLWETTTGKILRSLRANAAWIRGLAFGPQGNRLATTSDDGQVRVWKKRLPGADRGPTWSLACSSGPLDAGIVRAVAFSPPDGQLLAVATDSKTLRVLHAEDCSSAFDLENQGGWTKDIAFSTDGALLAAASDDAVVNIWNLATRKRSQVLLGHRDEVRALAFNSGARGLLATVSMDKTVRLWLASTGQLMHSFAGQPAGVRAVDFGKGGSLLAIASAQQTAVWDVQAKQVLFKLPQGSAVTAVRFSPDGSLLGTSSIDGRVQLWDTVSGQPRAELSAKDGGEHLPILALSFSPDGRLVASASLGRVNLWNLIDQSVQTQIFQGGASWAAWDSEGKLYRWDSGNLLWKRNLDGKITAVVPPRPAEPARLALTFATPPQTEADGRQENMVVTVTNAVGAGPAYWLWLEGSEHPSNHELRDTISILPSLTHLRLDPGESVDLKVQVRLRDQTRLPPRHVSICLALRHAHESHAVSACGGALSIAVPWLLGPWWWRYALELGMTAVLLSLLSGLVLLFLYRRWVFSNPVVKGCLAQQNPIAQLKLRELSSAERALKRAERFERGRSLRQQALSDAEISGRSWQRALAALISPISCAAQFAESLAAPSSTPPLPVYESTDLTAFRLALPLLSLNLPTEIVLLICGPTVADTQTAAARFTSQQLGAPKLVLFVDLTLPAVATADAKKVLEDTHPGTTFVVLSDAALKSILLTRDAAKAQSVLLEVIVSQSTLEQIVPYQEGGHELLDEHGCFFYGRQVELERMLERRRQNFLLSGPNFMGKSSLLNALRRELGRRYPTLKVSKYQLFTDSLIPNLAADPSFRGDSPEAFYDWVIKRSSEHQIFLFDEADKFIEKENATQLPFCSVMRALSGQGRASFILAGYHKLHEATSTADHPLRNFGELIRLGPLDLNSAERMIREPMTALGLVFSEPLKTVGWLLTQTGCRPHLLARACWAVVRLRKPPRAPAISLAEVVVAVLSCSKVREDFDSWQNGQVNPLDRALTRATLLLGRPTRQELLQYMNKRGAPLSAETMGASLSRLYSRHYALICDQDDRLYCPVPLFCHFLTDPRPEYPMHKHWSSPEERLADELRCDLAELQASFFALPQLPWARLRSGE